MHPAAIVDAHHHVWDLSVRDQDWLAEPDLAPLRRNFTVADYAAATAARVRTSVLVQTITVAEETPEFLALAAASDLIGGVVGWTDLTAPDVADRLAALRELPGGEHLVGIRHQVQGEADPEWLCRKDVRRGLRAVAQAGLAYDLLVVAHQLPSATATAQALPELRFVLDHLAKPLIAAGETEPWAADLRALAARDNVVAKISGLVTEAAPDWTPAQLRPYVDTALDAFGPRRLMFGSDWPVCLVAGDYDRVLATADELLDGLSPAEWDAVFGGVAVRTYRLPN